MNNPNTEELYKEIAEWITETGLEHTSNGSYYSYFEEIEKVFHVTEEWIKEHSQDIVDCFDFDVVAECELDDESFGLMFYLDYVCEKCQTYIDGNRCYDECGSCDCWCDNMDEDYEDEVIEYKPYVKTPEQIEAELKAGQWLKNRQQELSTLKFRRYIDTLWREEKETLREAGYFVYDLRDWDDGGSGYNIEPHVVVNNIGNWITDIDLMPYMNDCAGHWIGIDELALAQIEDIPYAEIKELLEKGREMHFADKKGE